MYFSIPDRRHIPRSTPDRRHDHATRALINGMISELRSTQLSIMFYLSVRPQDTRAQAMLDRVDNEVMYYAQHLCTLTATPEQCANGTGGTGYGIDKRGRKVCYECCADNDRQTLRTESKIVLYVTKRDGHYHVINWPSTLDIEPYRVREGRHNIAGKRLDVWFSFEGTAWHGVNIGDNDLLRCQKLKS